MPGLCSSMEKAKKNSCDKRRKIGEHAVSRSKKRFIAREIMTAITRHNKVQTVRSAN